MGIKMFKSVGVRESAAVRAAGSSCPETPAPLMQPWRPRSMAALHPQALDSVCLASNAWRRGSPSSNVHLSPTPKNKCDQKSV